MLYFLDISENVIIYINYYNNIVLSMHRFCRMSVSLQAEYAGPYRQILIGFVG